MNKSDVFLGSVLMLFCGWGWFETSNWVEIQTVGMSVKSYPRMIFTLIGICGLIMVIRGIKSKENVNIKFRWQTLIPVSIILILYAVGLEFIGFIISTFVFLVISMYVYGEKNLRKMTIIALAGTIIFYLLFVKFLGVQL